MACRESLKTRLLLEEVEPLLAEGGLGPAAGLGTMRPSTGASVVAPAAIIDFTHPSPARDAQAQCPLDHTPHTDSIPVLGDLCISFGTYSSRV